MLASICIAFLLIVGVGVLFYADSSRAVAQSNRPNIVIITSDDQDVDSLPVMRRLLSYPQGSWVNFNNAFSGNSVCTPSRATLLTGQYSHTNGVLGNNWGAEFNDYNALPVWLYDAGYRTAVIGKYLHEHMEDPPGWDEFIITEESVDAHTDLGVDFINAGDGPFFLWLAYRQPHVPAIPPDRYLNTDVYVAPDRPNFNEADVSDKSAHIRSRPLLGATRIAEIRAERIASQRSLLAIDDGIQTIIDTLAAAGELDNTLIIFQADNGFQWGSRRDFGKLCPYEECSRVALFIRYPGLGSNRIENHYVSDVDLASTILDYVDVAPGLPQDGDSLIPLIVNPATPWSDAVLIERPPGNVGYYAIRVPGWTYIEYHTGEKELYDMVADPYQLENKAGRAGYANIQNQLKNQLAALKEGDEPPPTTSTPTPTTTTTPTPTPTPTATPTSPAPAPYETIYVSSSAAVTIGGTNYADEDIMAYDADSGAWSLLFDGSDVGLGAVDVDAFQLRDNGTLLLSLDAPLTLAGAGAVDDSDVLLFTPTSLGPTTAGAWAMYIDGSDVGLTTTAENVDAIGLPGGGDLVLSVNGKAVVNGLTALDEGLLRFSPSQTGDNTQGSWSLYFDGSDVGLKKATEDVTGVTIDQASGRLYLTTLGNFAVTGLTGRRGDVFTCTPAALGATTQCTFGPGFVWRSNQAAGSYIALDGLDVDLLE